MTDQEVPAPDAVEQALPVQSEPGFVAPTLDPEVPEADALEQATDVPVDEEDQRLSARDAPGRHPGRVAAPNTSDQAQERGKRMYEHSCAKAGAEGCGYTVRAASEDELKAKVTEHARKKHNVQGMTDTIYNFLRDRARKN